MKAFLLTSLIGAAAGTSSLTTYHLVNDVGPNGGRYQMAVLPYERAVVTLDRETGAVRYIYGSDTVPSTQWAVEFKPGSVIGQVTPPEPPKTR